MQSTSYKPMRTTTHHTLQYKLHPFRELIDLRNLINVMESSLDLKAWVLDEITEKQLLAAINDDSSSFHDNNDSGCSEADSAVSLCLSILSIYLSIICGESFLYSYLNLFSASLYLSLQSLFTFSMLI